MIGYQKAEARIPVSQQSYVTFTAFATADVPAKIEKLTPDTLYAVQNQTLLNAIDVRLRDKYDNVDSGYTVHFTLTTGDGTIIPSFAVTRQDGSAAATFVAGLFDTINTIEAYCEEIPTKVFATVKVYKYLQIDSLKSAGGSVTLWWQQNLNSDFTSYELQRCDNSTFDSTTVTITIITDIAVTSATDFTAAAGTRPFYRLKVNFPSGFFFYTNKRDIAVQP